MLLHGLTSSSATWLPVLRRAGRHVHVIAPDLLGHGRSAKPRSGDYSVGAYASSLRDLLVALGLDRATVVGHSLGGGVALQFAYQIPELTERLVLVNSGGLGPEVSFALRAATIPGSTLAIRLATSVAPGWAGTLIQHALRVSRVLPAVDLAEAAQGLKSTAAPATSSQGHDRGVNALPHVTENGSPPGVSDIPRYRVPLSAYWRVTVCAWTTLGS